MKKNIPITTTTQSLAGELKKSSLVYTILYTILVCILSFLLIFGYFAVFTSYFYPTDFNGNYLVGVVDTQNYHDTEEGQTLIVQKYATATDIKVGDEVFFSGNAGEGSGVVLAKYGSQNYLKVLVGGEEKNISLSIIIGKVIQKKDVGGYILWFMQSWYGVAIVNVLLIIVIVARTIFGFTVETSKKGRELQQKLKQQKRAQRKLKKMYKNYKNTGLDIYSFELLDGDFEENKQKIQEFAKKRDLQNAYKFLLEKVHRVYISKHKISVEDRSKISNCIELMCLINTFDLDSEYMLTDLILKTHVIHFNLERFISSCKAYLSYKHTVEDISCFVSVLYVLVKKNKHLRKPEFYELIEKIEIYLTTIKEFQNLPKLLDLTNYVKKIIEI